MAHKSQMDRKDLSYFYKAGEVIHLARSSSIYSVLSFIPSDEPFSLQAQ